MQERNKLTALIDNSNDFIGLATPDRQALYLNPAGRRLVGLPLDLSASELKINDFFHDEDVAFVQDTILPTLRKEGH